MRKIRPARSFDIPPVRLFLEDIEEILQILRTLDDVQISTRNAEYDSLTELIEHEGVRPVALSLATTQLVLEFKRTRSGQQDNQPVDRLQSRAAVDDRPEQCFLLIRQRLLDRRRWYWLVASPLAVVLGALVLGAIALIALNGGTRESMTPVSGLAMAGLLAWSMFGITAYTSGLLSTVELVPSAEKSSWWPRHGAKLIIAVVSAAIGAAVYALVEALLLKKR